MKTKYLFIFLCIFILFLVNANTVKASVLIDFNAAIIPVQNKTDISEDYPTVDKIELRVLGSSYPREDIYNRLGRLETKLFGTVSKKSLSDRVDDLSKATIGANNNSIEEEDNSASSSKSSSENDSSSSSEESLNNLLNQMEKKLLNQVYPNDTTDTRVARLEQYLFKNSSDNYTMDERIERLATVIKARPSNEIYKDANLLKNSQLASTGLSLATIILMIVAGLLL